VASSGYSNPNRAAELTGLPPLAVRASSILSFMKILVTGATGLVGSTLVEALARDGHTVCRLVRPETKTDGGKRGAFDVAWNPETGELGGAGVGADAVVNLGGASIAAGRWSESRKRLLRSSRVEATHALVSALAKMNAKPAVLVSASAIGFYGSRGDEILTETSAPGADFLSDLAKDWEAEALRAESLRARVVLARFGIILAKQGGALPKMILPFRLGVGGRIASGRQWMSWVALDDVVASLKFALLSQDLRGPVNVVAPEAVTNLDFTHALARALHRPAIVPVPAPALKIALGREMAEALLLSSQRVMPAMLTRFGYRFVRPSLAVALNDIINRG
jgi:uncharacterized protein (TIGR01777 family)